MTQDSGTYRCSKIIITVVETKRSRFWRWTATTLRVEFFDEHGARREDQVVLESVAGHGRLNIYMPGFPMPKDAKLQRASGG